MNNYKICTKCHKSKSLDEFEVGKGRKGRKSSCKECRKEHDKDYRRKNSGAISHWHRLWREKHPDRVLLITARSSAKKVGVPFNLTIEDIIVPNFCPVLGFPLFVGNGGRTDNSPSVDRINPKKGYVKGNIKIISWRANRLKQDATVEEMEKLLDYVRNNSRGEI